MTWTSQTWKKSISPGWLRIFSKTYVPTEPEAQYTTIWSPSLAGPLKNPHEFSCSLSPTLTWRSCSLNPVKNKLLWKCLWKTDYSSQTKKINLWNTCETHDFIHQLQNDYSNATKTKNKYVQSIPLLWKITNMAKWKRTIYHNSISTLSVYFPLCLDWKYVKILFL